MIWPGKDHKLPADGYLVRVKILTIGLMSIRDEASI